MNIKKYIFAIGVVMASLYACKKDDDGIASVPPRDRDEQQADEDPKIQEYLKSHFYSFLEDDSHPDYATIHFDTIAGADSNEVSIWDSGLLKSKKITRDDIEYTLYILNHTEGGADAIGGGDHQPTFADSTFVTYRGELLYDNKDADGDGIPDEADVDADNDGEPDVIDEVTRVDTDGDGIADDSDVDNTSGADSDNDGIIDENDPVDNNDPNRRVFDSAVTPVWFDLVNIVEGFREAVVEYKGASDFTMPDGDGNISYNTDFGHFTVFMPSGLGYFNSPPSGGGIFSYSSLIFTVQLYGVNESDHDRDGIPSYLEDLDTDRLVFDEDDNTDGDSSPNYLDIDDDGDGTLTEDEITVLGDLNNDGRITLDEITFYDDDGDGIKNHLDPDDSDGKND